MFFYVQTFVVAVVFAAILVVLGKFSFEETLTRRRFLSAAAGGSIAYIFVKLLPELQTAAAIFRHAHPEFMPFEGAYGINLAVMTGFLCFYATNEMMRSESEEMQQDKTTRAFWAQTMGYGGYVGLVAYLLVRSFSEEVSSLLFYSISMGLHFLLIGVALRDAHRENYDRIGRYALAGFCLAGWLLGVMNELPVPLLILLFGFVSGGVLSVTVIVELPKGGESRTSSLLLGALGYSLFLILGH